MRILFDGYWWVGGPPSGRQVLREQLLTWVEQFPQDEVLVAVPKKDVPVIERELQGLARVMPYRLPQHALACTIELGFLARKYKVDWTFSQNFTPLTGRSATFFYDALFQASPEWFTRSERLYLALIPILARRAKKVFTLSASEARRISEHNPRLKDVVPVGVYISRELVAASPKEPDDAPPGGEFLLTVGRLNIRKNLQFTIDAALESGAISAAFPLVIVGPESGRKAKFGSSVAEAVEVGAIRFVGNVSDAELKWYYINAKVFAFMSLDEGFGLPPVEAMAFGHRPIVSDIPVFREVLGSLATYVDPHDTSALAAELSSALRAARFSDPTMREQIRLRHSWERSAQQTREELMAADAGPVR